MRHLRLKNLVDINQRALAEDTDPGYEFRYVDIGSVGRGTLTAEPQLTTFGEAPSRARRIVRPGDTIVSTVRTYLRAVWPVPKESSDLIVSTGFAVLSPRPGIDARYLGWLTQSDIVVEDVVARSVGVSYPAINANEIGDVRVQVPPLASQRAIADYLDRETARIDTLIEKRLRMVELLEERIDKLIEDVVWSEVGTPLPLKHRVQPDRPIMYGIVLPGPAVAEGVPIVKGGDVAVDRLTPDSLARTTYEIEAPYARARLRAGDLVFAIRGGIGDVEVVPPALEGTNITQDVARVAPATDVEPMWLRFVLRSTGARRQVAELVTGATIKGLNIWDLKRVRVPPSDPDRQRADIAKLSAEESRVTRLVDALRDQSRLLTDRREALITAAVRGEIEIPGAAA